MKFTKILLAAVISFGLMASSAFAQFQIYKDSRALVLSQGQSIVVGASTVTNGPIDKAFLVGNGEVIFFPTTNSVGTTLTATLYGSPDTTNLTAIANYPVTPSIYQQVITNMYWGTNSPPVVTNNVLLPGTWTYPTAASSGFATPYITYYPATNSTITLTKNTPVVAQVNMTDCPRYLYVVYNGGGTVTNATVSAVLVAPNQQP